MKKQQDPSRSIHVRALVSMYGGVSFRQMDKDIFEAKMLLSEERRSQLEQAFEDELEKVRNTNCDTDIFEKLVEQKEWAVEKALEQCIMQKKEGIPERPFILNSGHEIVSFGFFIAS